MGRHLLRLQRNHITCRLLAAVFAIPVLAWTQAVLSETRIEPLTQPLTLEQAIDLALARNPNLHAAQARIETARARLEEARAAFFPQVKAGIGYTLSNDPSRAFSMIVAQRRFAFGMNINDPGYVKDFRPQIGIHWSLFRGGQDYSMAQTAALGLDVRTAQKTALQNALANAVSTSFYALLEAPERSEVARRTLAAVGKELEFVRARKLEGMALNSDILSLEVRLAQAKATQIQAENAREAALTALRALLAWPAQADLKVRADSTFEPPRTAGDFAGWLDAALARRPELKAARAQVEALEQALQAARGARLPRIDAFAVYGQNSPEPQFSTRKDNVTFGVQAEIDLFTGGARTARIEQARKQLEEARALLDLTRLQVEQEVKQAWLSLREALARLEVARYEVDAAKAALRLVREQYRSGTATVTRFLEAETDAASARLHLISARFNALTANAEMKRAAGLWTIQETSP